MRQRLIGLAVTALVLYGVAPAILQVLGAFDDLGRIEPWWWIAVVVTQAAALGCFAAVQRIAMHTDEWFPVVASNLASGALGRVVPGGSATAAALQYQMLVRANIGGGAAATGLTAGSLLLLATLAALPLLALPAVIGGVHVPRSLLNATLVGLGLFAVLFALGLVLMRGDAVVEWIGRAVTWVACRVRRRQAPPEDLPGRLLRQRDLVRSALGERWPLALSAAAGRWLFDFLTLLAALAAVGAHPRLSLALLAYCTAQLLAQLPLTPGGLGIVEAGMTRTPALIGVSGRAAAPGTPAHRPGPYLPPLPARAAARFPPP